MDMPPSPPTVLDDRVDEAESQGESLPDLVVDVSRSDDEAAGDTCSFPSLCAAMSDEDDAEGEEWEDEEELAETFQRLETHSEPRWAPGLASGEDTDARSGTDVGPGLLQIPSRRPPAVALRAEEVLALTALQHLMYNTFALGEIPPEFGMPEVLDDVLGAPPSSSKAINALEKEVFGDTAETECSHSQLQCTICLAEYEEGDELRRMPCSHRFHESCVGQWLTRHGTCPVCRFELSGDKAPPAVHNEVIPVVRERSHTPS